MKNNQKIIEATRGYASDLPKIGLKNSAVDAICHGADLAIPGFSSLKKIKEVN